VIIDVSAENNTVRETVLKLVFGQTKGFACVATIERKEGYKDGKKFTETFFRYPDDMALLLEHVNRVYPSHDVYFCPQLFDYKKRIKEGISEVQCAWSDLDSCDPRHLLVKPTVTLESSPGHYQAFWVFQDPQNPEVAEEVSRRIAYAHSPQGADRSGWDLTQLLRMPMTYNLKRSSPTMETPVVKVIDASRRIYRLEDFAAYPIPKGFEYTEIPMPEEEDLPPQDADEILQSQRLRINPAVWRLYGEEPDGDWSKILWQLEMLLFETGLDRNQVFVVAKAAKCNKYARDDKPDSYLWRDVCKAEQKHLSNLNILYPRNFEEKELLTEDERAWVEANPGFVERYIEWAKGLGDAAPQYHQAGALIALSSVLSGSVRLPTSFGTIIPNLWFMILADTTLTRKSTAMDIAMDLVMEIDQDAVLATDGSIEGLMTSLSMRPGRPSIFLRDEFSGLLEQMTKKDYMAGMPEAFTKLYDGKFQKRILRKESIEVREPVLILFAGGIKDKITSLLTFEQVASGFMPRFIFITAESDVTRLKPIGPPSERDVGNRQAIKDELLDLYSIYNEAPKSITLAGTPTFMPQTKCDATLTDDAWVRYNKIESAMMDVGMRSERPDLMTPTYDRLCKSMLKSAVLMAAARQKSRAGIVVEDGDIVHATYFMEGWRHHVKEVISKVGLGTAEKQLANIFRAVQRREGVTRSVLMQNYHLTARDADQIFQTLEQRGLIRRVRVGKTETLYATRKEDA
jgi:ribosomal protein S25